MSLRADPVTVAVSVVFVRLCGSYSADHGSLGCSCCHMCYCVCPCRYVVHQETVNVVVVYF